MDIKSWFKDKISEIPEDYEEISPKEKTPKDIIIKTFILEDDVKLNSILNLLREGKTIAILNVAALRDKDYILKHIINKFSYVCEEINGDFVKLSELWYIATPKDIKYEK